MQNMKRFFKIFLCGCLLLLAGCAKEPETVVIGITVTGQADAASPAVLAEGAPAASPAPSDAGGKTQAKVQDTVAYVLSCAEGPTLYGAVAYENTGDTPLTLTQADFAFTLADHVEEVTFTPVFAKETVVLPGETAYAALWYTMADLVPGAQVELSRQLLSRYGIKALPIRKPTVPEGTERLRFSLSSAMMPRDIEALDKALGELM